MYQSQQLQAKAAALSEQAPELRERAAAQAARLGLDLGKYLSALVEKDLAEHAGARPLRFSSEDRAGLVNRKEYTMIRLTDPQYAGLFEISVPLRPDYGTMMRLQMNLGVIYSSNARMLATLRSLFGESGKCFDDWKGSFSFPLLVFFEHNRENVTFLLNLTNVRTSVDFGVRLLMPAGGRRNGIDAGKGAFGEFPAEEISSLYMSLVRFLTHHFEVIRNDYSEDFHHSVPSNLLVFGHKDGRFFEFIAKNQEQYDGVIAALADGERESAGEPKC